VLIRRQARVNPLRALARLAATVPSIAAGTTARSAKIKGGRVVTVATSAGDISPGTVVFATGMPPVLDGLAPGPPGRDGHADPTFAAGLAGYRARRVSS
jgi:glycine/D-amino acid oxidase-like deaminating enzyme